MLAATITSVILESCENRYRNDKASVASFSDLNQDYYPEEVTNRSTNKPLKYINIHCTASKGELSKEWLLNFFYNERGWSKPGYNLVVHMNGYIDTLVPFNGDGFVSYDEITYGVAGKNSESINVAYTGGVDEDLNPMDTRTRAQRNSLLYIVAATRCRFPGVKVVGHRDHPHVAKACPSFSVMDEYYDYPQFIKAEMSKEAELFDSARDSMTREQLDSIGELYLK